MLDPSFVIPSVDVTVWVNCLHHSVFKQIVLKLSINAQPIRKLEESVPIYCVFAPSSFECYWLRVIFVYMVWAKHVDSGVLSKEHDSISSSLIIEPPSVIKVTIRVFVSSFAFFFALL